MVVVWAGVLAEVSVEDKNRRRSRGFLNRQGVLGKNTKKWREVNENIDLW